LFSGSIDEAEVRPESLPQAGCPWRRNYEPREKYLWTTISLPARAGEDESHSIPAPRPWRWEWRDTGTRFEGWWLCLARDLSSPCVPENQPKTDPAASPSK